MRLTDQQIRHTVAAMHISQLVKTALLKQALEQNDPGARFIIYAAWKRQHAA